MEIFACVLIGYLIGAFSPSYIIGMMNGYDIRKKGSGNAGASNVILLKGKKIGAFCAILDIAKACLMDRSGVSRAFKDFEEKGLIIRKVDEENKRAYKITLTEKGIETAEFLIQKETEWDKMICEELDISREDLLKLLSKISLKSLEFNRQQF